MSPKLYSGGSQNGLPRIVLDSRIDRNRSREVRMPKWFTSVELDEGLMAKALRLSQAKTKKALFDLVLRTYVRLHDQAEVHSAAS